jgi:hypothetical protein
MAQDGFFYDLASKLQIPWKSSDAPTTSDHSNDEVVVQPEAGKDPDDNSALTKISIMFQDLYKTYYSSENSQATNEDIIINAIKNSKDCKIGQDAQGQTMSRDLLLEIQSAGSTLKLNKVIPTKKEIKSEHELTSVLSSALNARKGVIMDCEDIEDEEWDDN